MASLAIPGGLDQILTSPTKECSGRRLIDVAGTEQGRLSWDSDIPNLLGEFTGIGLLGSLGIHVHKQWPGK